MGILAPILLVALRLAQGFGAGAEIAGATVMLAESAPVKRRGLVASLVSLGTNSGTLGATALWAILVATLTEDQLLSWGWRIPFLASFILLILAIWIRRTMKESPVFEARADTVDGVALSKAELEKRAATRSWPGPAPSRPPCTSARASRSSSPSGCGSVRPATRV